MSRRVHAEVQTVGPSPNLLAGDSDRDRVVGDITEAHIQGRLTVEEFQARLDAAMSARTFGQLELLTSDLPAATALRVQKPVRGSSGPARVAGWFMSWSGWATVSALLVLDDIGNQPGDPIAAPFAHPLSPWPLLVMIPYGIVVARRRRRQPRTAIRPT